MLKVPAFLEARLAATPGRGGWIALADVDEFPILPSPLGGGAPSRTLAAHLTKLAAGGFTVLAGYTVDRSRKGGSLEAPRAAPSIWKQFPVRSAITARCAECRANKAVAYRRFGSPQTAWNSDKGGHHAEHFTLPSARCEAVERWAEVAHFKWWGDLDSYLAKRVTDAGRVAKATQEMLDDLMAAVPQGRCFVRPSGTEDVVRVYAEAATQADADALALKTAQAVHELAGGVGEKPTAM